MRDPADRAPDPRNRTPSRAPPPCGAVAAPRAQRVLIVSPRAECRSAYRRLLEAEGFGCDEAVNGGAAVESLRRLAADVVLIDSRLAEGPGLDLCRQLRTEAPLPHLKLVLLTGVSALNMNMILPSLPSLARHYAADYAVVTLTVSAYLGLTAVLQLVLGPLSDRFGRRPVVLASLAVFLLATLGCVLAPNIHAFLAFRMLQATVASGIALSRAIVRDMVPPDQAASLIGYVTMGMSLMPMVGPIHHDHTKSFRAACGGAGRR